MDDDTAALSALAQRPSMEEEVARLTMMRDEVRDRLAADLGLAAWSDLEDEGEAGCPDFPGNDGRTGFVSALLLTGGVPDAQWPESVRVLSQVAADYGFGEPETVVDNPGQHQVVLRGERESMVRFSTLMHATLSAEFGCHLPAAIRDAG